MNTYNPNSAAPTDKHPEVDSRDNETSSLSQKSAKRKGIASLIIGIILLLFVTFGQFFIFLPYSEFSHYSKGTPLDYMLLMCVLLPFPLVIGIIGVVQGAKSRKAMQTGNGIGKAGLITSIIATAIITVCFIVSLIIVITAIATWGQN